MFRSFSITYSIAPRHDVGKVSDTQFLMLHQGNSESPGVMSKSQHKTTGHSLVFDRGIINPDILTLFSGRFNTFLGSLGGMP